MEQALGVGQVRGHPASSRVAAEPLMQVTPWAHTHKTPPTPAPLIDITTQLPEGRWSFLAVSERWEESCTLSPSKP